MRRTSRSAGGATTRAPAPIRHRRRGRSARCGAPTTTTRRAPRTPTPTGEHGTSRSVPDASPVGCGFVPRPGWQHPCEGEGGRVVRRDPAEDSDPRPITREERTMHAVVLNVEIDPNRTTEAFEGLKTMVVPSTVASPGFVRGVWTGDHEAGGAGIAMVLFDTEEHARAMTEAIDAPADSPVRITDVAIQPVAAEA